MNNAKKYSFATKLNFIVPSIIGLILFMFPLYVDGNITILVAILSGNLQATFANVIPTILVVLCLISMLGAILYQMKIKWVQSIPLASQLFRVNPIWLSIRIFAFIFAAMIYFGVDFEMITGGNTGGMVFYDLLPVLFSVFLFAGLFLPLLLNFGLLEFIGALLIKVMRPIFNLPGRSAIDCITSWLGDGTIGVILTSKQFESKHYTQREAAVIGTTFSLVSVTFTLVIINTVGLEHMFLPFYFAVCVSSLVCALIVPRIYPLNKKPDLCIDGSKPKNEEVIPKGTTAFKYGIQLSLERSEKESLAKNIFKEGVTNVLEMWIAVVPVVLGVGTIALILAEFTPLFKILGLPFYPILLLLNVPEALAASQTLAAGFADMLLPSVLATNITSDFTRFIIAAVSVSQLIYLSEVGSLLIGSKIPVSFKDLVFIFVERTVIALPVITLIAHLFF